VGMDDWTDDDPARLAATLEAHDPEHRSVWGELLRARVVVRAARTYLDDPHRRSALVAALNEYEQYAQRPGLPPISFEL
jgi:hypothetical protein